MLPQLATLHSTFGLGLQYCFIACHIPVVLSLFVEAHGYCFSSALVVFTGRIRNDMQLKGRLDHH